MKGASADPAAEEPAEVPIGVEAVEPPKVLILAVALLDVSYLLPAIICKAMYCNALLLRPVQP